MAKHVLIVSGLDPSGGAGFIADVRVVSEHGLRPVGVVSALTEQDTSGVRAVEAANAERVDGQLHALLSDVEIAAVKIGMLGDEHLCKVVSDALQLTAAPVVWDPIVRPTRGGVALYAGNVVDAAATLADHLTLVTPNIAEAELLCGQTIDSVKTMHSASLALHQRLDCAVLITGGHLAGENVIDVLASNGATQELSGDRITGGTDVHGTGCALSSAIACGLATGVDLVDAIDQAKRFVVGKLAAPATPGRGSAAVV